MERPEIIETVNGFLVDEFEIEEELLSSHATWKEIGIDSLDFVDIVVIIEQTFGFRLNGEEMSNIKTLNEFYDHIMNRIASKN